MSDSPPLQFKNPFVGLRAFEENEHFLFFGRDKPIEDLSNRLINNRFLAVIGSSGSGKSSLVKSGLLPNIFSGFFTPGRNWRVALIRPGEDPIGYLTNELAAKGTLYNYKEQNDIPYASIIEASLRRSENGLVQVYKEAFGLLHIEDNEIQKKKTDNLLIVVDQFEELFRFRKYEKDKNLGISDAQHFIKLLLTASQQSECPVYVLLTMRSDFLGDCSEFNGLPEAINNGQYLVPRMTREEIRQCIENPVAVGNTRITPRLVSRLLNVINNDTDQLPILQHALMRLWDAWYERMLGYWEVAKLAKKNSLEDWNKWTDEKWKVDVKTMNYTPEELEIKKKKREKKMLEVWQQSSINDDFSFNAWYYRNTVDTEIDFDDYDKIGGLGKALSNHADEAYGEFKTEDEQKICELMFKALTDKTADARGTRRPRKVLDLCQLCNTNEEEIIRQVEVFRKPGRTFLMPPIEKGPLTNQSIIDISHESLMRLWERLIKWTEEEAQNSEIFKRIAEAARRKEKEKENASFYSGPDLQQALLWHAKFKDEDLIKEWAKPFNTDTKQDIAQQALDFLNKSNEIAIAEKEKTERLEKDKKDKEEELLAAKRQAAEDEKERAREKAEEERQRAVEEQDRAREKKEAGKKRRRMFIVIVALAFFGVAITYLWNEAVIAKADADSQKDSALAAKEYAVKQKEFAEKARHFALAQKDSAEKAKAVADSLSIIALAQKDSAVTAKADAEKQRKLAQDAEARAEKLKVEAEQQNKKSAAAHYQKQIRTFITSEEIISKNPDTTYCLVSYCNHLDTLNKYKIPGAVIINYELYDKLYFCLKTKGKSHYPVKKETLNIAAKSDTLQLGNNFRLYPDANKLILIYGENKKDVLLQTNNPIIALCANTDRNIILYATEDNNLYIHHYDNNKKTILDTLKIFMGGQVTAVGYYPEKNIIYFGLETGQTGFITYTIDGKNQPVYRNNLYSKITAVQIFKEDTSFYFLATSKEGNAVVYNLGSVNDAMSNYLIPNKNLRGIELPEYFGKINYAFYDPKRKKIVLDTKKGTYLWNPFVEDLLTEIKAIPGFAKQVAVMQKKTKIYQ